MPHFTHMVKPYAFGDKDCIFALTLTKSPDSLQYFDIFENTELWMESKFTSLCLPLLLSAARKCPFTRSADMSVSGLKNLSSVLESEFS